MKFSRRQWAGMAGGAAAAAVGLAQTAPPATPPPATAAESDPLQVARDNNKRLSDVLSRFEIPLATEPAFQFKA